MKLRLMIALAIIALVLGMAITACDNGDLPKIKPGTTETIYDINFIGTGVDGNGNIQNPKSDTTGNSAGTVKIGNSNVPGGVGILP